MHVLAIVVAALVNGPVAFHPPHSEAERAVDAMLHRLDADPQAFDNLVGGRDPAFHRSVDYTDMLTPALLAAIRRAEARTVQAECGGHYIAGVECGLEAMPATCAQDSSDHFLFRTQVEDGRIARLDYAFAVDDPLTVATYRLVRDGGRWLIDGIDCGSGVSFND